MIEWKVEGLFNFQSKIAIVVVDKLDWGVAVGHPDADFF